MGTVRPLLAVLVAAAAVGGVVVGAAGGSPAAAVPTCAETGAYVAPPPQSVGTPAGLRLCPAGGILEVRTAGAVLDGLDLTGGVLVSAPGVVVRRSRISGDGSAAAGVRTLPGGSVRIEDTTLTGDFTEAALAGADWTAERVEVTGLRADGAHLGPGATLRNSLLHAFDPAPGREVDAVTVAASDALVEGNRVQLGSGPGRVSAVRITGPAAGVNPVHQSLELDDPGDPAVVRGNELGGGRFTLLAADPGDLPPQITGNRFLRDPAAVPLRLRGAADLRDNVFTDGGAVRR
jgi:hypothetical protein